MIWSAQEMSKKFRMSLGKNISPRSIHVFAEKLGYHMKRVGGKKGYDQSLYTALTRHLKELLDYDSQQTVRTPQKPRKQSKEIVWDDGNYEAYNGERDNNDYEWEKNESINKYNNMKRINLTESYLHSVLKESINEVLQEAGGTLTFKRVTSNQRPIKKFNHDEDVKKALSYSTPSELYRDANLVQRLRYNRMEDGRSYLDYVKEIFAKEGRYNTNKRGTNRMKKINWTPQSAIEYSSNFLNGMKLSATPEGRSCYHYLKVNNLLDKAFKKARKDDASKASDEIYRKEKELQKKREQKAAMAALRKSDAEARKQQRIKDKENLRIQKQIDRDIAKDNKLQARIARKNQHDAERLSMSSTPSHLRRYSPGLYKRMVADGSILKHYPDWEQVNNIWRKK